MDVLFLVNDKSELAPDLYAVFPLMRNNKMVDGFAVDSGHTSISEEYIEESRLAEPEEYLPILGLLEKEYGYDDLVIVKRLNY